MCIAPTVIVIVRMVSTYVFDVHIEHILDQKVQLQSLLILK